MFEIASFFRDGNQHLHVWFLKFPVNILPDTSSEADITVSEIPLSDKHIGGVVGNGFLVSFCFSLFKERINTRSTFQTSRFFYYITGVSNFVVTDLLKYNSYQYLRKKTLASIARVESRIRILTFVNYPCRADFWWGDNPSREEVEGISKEEAEQEEQEGAEEGAEEGGKEEEVSEPWALSSQDIVDLEAKERRLPEQ